MVVMAWLLGTLGSVKPLLSLPFNNCGCWLSPFPFETGESRTKKVASDNLTAELRRKIVLRGRRLFVCLFVCYMFLAGKISGGRTYRPSLGNPHQGWNDR